MFDDDFFFSTLTGSQEVLLVKVNPDFLVFDWVGAPQTVELTASGFWKVNIKPSWVTVTPSSGTGNATLTIDPQKNIGGWREGEIFIESGGLMVSIYVEQWDKYIPL